jgi:RNA polymerase sigma-70 factor, ECF subfamily
VSLTDVELIARAAGGDLTAFQLLYERHWNAVYRFAWLLTNSVPDAEDITQECFLALFRKPAFFDPVRAQLRTWLIAVARNQHLQRRRNLALQASPADLETSGVPAGLEEELIRLERADAVRRAVDALPPVQREALYLFEFEGLSLADIAVVLEIQPNAVKARLYRARGQLRLLLAPLRPAPSLVSEDAHDE